MPKPETVILKRRKNGTRGAGPSWRAPRRSFNAGAWKLLLGARHDGPAPRVPFFRLFRITVSGFGINYVTPFLAPGGEPYKGTALSRLPGPRRAASRGRP